MVSLKTGLGDLRSLTALCLAITDILNFEHRPLVFDLMWQKTNALWSFSISLILTEKAASSPEPAVKEEVGRRGRVGWSFQTILKNMNARWDKAEASNVDRDGCCERLRRICGSQRLDVTNTILLIPTKSVIKPRGPEYWPPSLEPHSCPHDS